MNKTPEFYSGSKCVNKMKDWEGNSLSFILKKKIKIYTNFGFKGLIKIVRKWVGRKFKAFYNKFFSNEQYVFVRV